MASGMSAARGLADRLAVVPGLGDREHLEVLLDAVGDLVEDQRALGDAGPAPCGLGRMCGVERRLDVLASERAISQNALAVDRRDVLEISARAGFTQLAADEVVVAFGEGTLGDAEEFHLVH